ncbi:zinc finger BED domain-containing protein 4-like [Haemaphysalis longicornis]
MVHKEEAEELGAKRQRTLDTTVAVFRQQQCTKQKVPASSDLQKSFNRYVAEMVALDGVPLSVTKGLGFRRLIAFSKPELNLPSPRTISKQLDELASHFALPVLQGELHSVPSGTLHFIVDIWTSRTRNAVLGIRVQYVKDWQLRCHTFTFCHMRGRHTGENIRETFVAELESKGVNEEQVGTVVCDNAANMSKAFNMAFNFTDKWPHASVDVEDCDEETTDENSLFVEDAEESVLIPAFKRVCCAAHTLQLAVHSALHQDESAQKRLETINKTVNVFRRSCFWTEQLREERSKDLVPPSGTRWNSLVEALKRLTEV